MSTLIDEGIAWSLVRAVTPGSAPTRVELDAVPGARLDVAEDGTWEASAETTEEAGTLLDVFLPIRLAEELVVGQLGQSLDGRIATEAGASHFVTGRQDIERLHRLRALVDAVIVGATTVVLDDPRLTVRFADGPDPVRVVLDPSGRLAADRRVFAASEEGRTIVVRAADAGPGTPGTAPGAAISIPWSEDDGFDLHALLRALRTKGLRRILVEGGGVTVSRFLEAGLLDRLHLTVAPVLIGSGRPSITLDPVVSLDDAIRPACRRFTLGEDVLFDLDLRSAPPPAR